MFWVWDATGLQRDYQPDQYRVNRRVRASQASKGVKPRAGSDDKKHEALQKYQEHDSKPKERSPAIIVSQIMSSPVETLQESVGIAEAAAFFEEHRFRHVPIMNIDNKLVGILADRDILRRQEELTIKDVMATEILTTFPETEIREVAKVLIQERIGAMPVVDQSAELVGILTRSDILRAVVSHNSFELWV